MTNTKGNGPVVCRDRPAKTLTQHVPSVVARPAPGNRQFQDRLSADDALAENPYLRLVVERARRAGYTEGFNTAADVARRYGVSRTTLYSRVGVVTP